MVSEKYIERMNDHDCDVDGHEVLDERVTTITAYSTSMTAEVRCKHGCDYYAEAHYKIDYNNLDWKEAY